MFFALEKSANPRYPRHIKLGNLYLNIDEGWHVYSDELSLIVYKGYVNDVAIDDAIDLITSSIQPMLDGNFCVFEFRYDEIYLYQPLYRSFPIYYTADSITNLQVANFSIAANHHIQAIHQDLTLETRSYDPVGPIDSELSEDQVVFKIYDILHSNISNFLKHNTLPVKAFLTGGVDSMLIYSFVKNIIKPELIDCQYLQFDEFWCSNSFYIRKHHWAYQQIHHWRESCVLLSGTPGDEFMLRSPTTSNLYLMNHNSSILQSLGDEHHLHSHYFMKYGDLYDSQMHDPMMKKLVKDKRYLYPKLCDMILNDFQHWHLGNTITFTPLRNMEIFKLMLQLPYESAVSQIIDSTISKRLIAMNDPKLLDHLSNDKNDESFNKIWQLLEGH